MALLLGKLVLMGVTSEKNSNIAELLLGSLSLGFKGETSKHSGYKRGKWLEAPCKAVGRSQKDGVSVQT